MKFGIGQSKRFETSVGAYSIVTERENYDSQVTLTDYEAQIVVAFFGQENIHIGNVKSNRERSSKTFKLFPTGKNINLNLNYPKPEKTELRLYISAQAGFKPNPLDVMFIFIRDDNIWIGSMMESEWRHNTAEIKNDESDFIYQESITETDEVRIARLRERDIYVRDRRLALKRIEIANFQCESNTNHELFISRSSRTPYLEAHHLIPIGIQSEFEKRIDTLPNIFCLCPNCHRAVHHAEESFARSILSNLAKKRSVLEDFSLSISELFKLYGVEEID